MISKASVTKGHEFESQLEVFNGVDRPNGSRVELHFNGSLAGQVINGPWCEGSGRAK